MTEQIDFDKEVRDFLDACQRNIELAKQLKVKFATKSESQPELATVDNK